MKTTNTQCWRNKCYPILAQYIFTNIGATLECCIILPQYWRNIAFIGQFAPICSILDQYYANIACYTGSVRVTLNNASDYRANGLTDYQPYP